MYLMSSLHIKKYFWICTKSQNGLREMAFVNQNVYALTSSFREARIILFSHFKCWEKFIDSFLKVLLNIFKYKLLLFKVITYI